MRRLFLAVLLIVTWSGGVRAATYYVSLTGVDTSYSPANCTVATNIATPKRHIGGTDGAARCAVAGDIIDVRGGTYPENFKAFSQTLASGTAGNPITVQGHVGETVWIQPTGCTGIDFGAVTAKLEISPHYMDGHLMGGGLTVLSPLPESANGMVLQDLECKDASNNGGGGGTALCLQASADNMLITNVHMHGTHQTFGDFQGSYTIYATTGNTVIEKSLFHDTGGYGVQFNDSAGPVGGWTGNIFRYNTVYNTGRRSGGGTGGVVANNAQNGTLIHSNVIYGVVKGAAIDVFGSNNSGVRVYNNTIVDSPSCIAGGPTGTGTIVKITSVRITRPGLRSTPIVIVPVDPKISFTGAGYKPTPG
jgi:hypothetical protein